MSLSDLASLGSFVSGLAVLISLVYVGYQVQQASKHQRALITQGQTDRVTDIVLQLAQPGLVTAWDKAVSGEELSRSEARQFILMAMALFRTHEESYDQHRDGLLTDAAYETNSRSMRMSMTVPGMRAAWKQLGPSFERGFREVIDDFVKTGSERGLGFNMPAFLSALKNEASAVATAAPRP
jgi:hypothetical protein